MVYQKKLRAHFPILDDSGVVLCFFLIKKIGSLLLTYKLQLQVTIAGQGP